MLLFDKCKDISEKERLPIVSTDAPFSSTNNFVGLSSFPFDDVACKSVGTDEVAQFTAVCVEDGVAVALP